MAVISNKKILIYSKLSVWETKNEEIKKIESGQPFLLNHRTISVYDRIEVLNIHPSNQNYYIYL